MFLNHLSIKLADETERDEIYHLRHKIFAEELKQHKTNKEKILKDEIDNFNIYIVVKIEDKLIGFVSITPPGKIYSMDKYISRSVAPFVYDQHLYEVRLLGILNEYRTTKLIIALLYSAGVLINSRGGTNIMILGRSKISDIYHKIGLNYKNIKVTAGEVIFDIMGGIAKNCLIM